MVSGLIARMSSLWRGVRRRSQLDGEMDDEFRLHLELRAADLVRSGVPVPEAARQARLEFGSTEHYKDLVVVSRGLRRFDALRMSWLDFKLGFRMLVRYPGLTIVGGLAMAFAIWVGAGAFELATQVLRPQLPLPHGEGIVAIRNWDASTSRVDARSLRDFIEWKQELRSVEDIGAYRAVERNLISGEGSGVPVEIAEISASAFHLTRVPPLLGRTLVEGDEDVGAPNVVVIGYDAWQRQFAGDANIVGRTVRLGTTLSTVAGVMPEGFAFPVTQSFWVPLRLSPTGMERRQGPEIRVFGRLASGATLDDAQAELATLGARTTKSSPETHQHLRPQVMPFAKSVVNIRGWMALGVMSINLPLIMLVVLICGNVALLMFARAATREAEIAVRNALGAGRGRIIMQLFTEALVLGAVAAVIGLAAAGFGLSWVMGVIEVEFLEGARLPFWFQERLSVTTVVYAGLLTVFGAVIAGVIPALKVTRGGNARLNQATAGGGGLRLGGVWTAVIVAQVAVTVAFPAVAYFVRRDAVQIEAVDLGFPARQYLSVRIEKDRNTESGAAADASQAAHRARFANAYQELARRIAAEPGVNSVAFGDRLPYMYHPHRLIELDEGVAAPRDPRWPDGYRVTSATVDPDFFGTFAAPAIAGRGFLHSDYTSGAGGQDEPTSPGGVVVVNQSFVRLVMGDHNPIGRRVRYLAFEETEGAVAPGPWYEIVGVVRDLGTAVGADVGQGAGGDPKVAGFYHVVAPGGVYPGHMAVHVRGDPEAFASRLRQVATAADPTLRLYAMMPLADVTASELEFLGFWFRLVLLVSAVALTLSLAGIYAVMSFTVSRRTREIGVRVALGADSRRVISTIFARPLAQIGVGVLAGGILVALLVRAATGGFRASDVAFAIAYVALMLGVCLLACIVPTRRALRVQPTEALRGDG